VEENTNVLGGFNQRSGRITIAGHRTTSRRFFVIKAKFFAIKAKHASQCKQR
jgi:hypothetical protein